MNFRNTVAAVLALLLAGGTLPAFAGARADAASAAQQDPADSTDRLIVKLRDPSQDVASRLPILGGRVGERLTHLRQMSGRAHVVQIGRRLSRAEAHALARQLASDPEVEYVEPDLRLHPQRVPNDTRYGEQWNYFNATSGINLPAAWDVTVGSADIVVAVVDTGIVAHADLTSRVVAGYDFISDAAASNDGDGRDGNAADSGDYGCNGTSSSSWHGTHVAGTIGAASNNGIGVAGVNWGSKLQPVRVLGRCGGYTSDIVDGMRWAAGMTVVGVPTNPTPARVENLSLGGSGACSTTFQNAIDDVVARGTVVVVAAGNSGVDAVDTQPANCNGVVTVGAITPSGGRAGYSNYGSKLTLSAPGSGILSTLNAGGTTPVASPGGDTYVQYSGTSMATPHVAGVVSLMLSVNPALTPQQVIAKLKSSARPFPTGTGADCTTAMCGAGIVDAYAALGVVQAPTPTNVALAANGGVVSVSSSYSAARFPPQAVNDGSRVGAYSGSNGTWWADGTYFAGGDWLQVDFAGTKRIGEIDVFMQQDNYSPSQTPTETMTFTRYGIINFLVQYWNGTAWQTVPGGNVTGNNLVWRKFTFTPVSTDRIRVYTTGLQSNSYPYSILTEVEAWTAP